MATTYAAPSRRQYASDRVGAAPMAASSPVPRPSRMHSVVVALVVLAGSFGAALVGMAIAPRLPRTHVGHETKRTVEHGMALIATLSGLVLGLLVSTSKSAFDSADTEVKEIAAKLVVLDRVLARYGPETTPVRTELRHYVARKIDEIWGRSSTRAGRRDWSAGVELEDALDRLSDLRPTTDVQHVLKSRALALAGEVAQARWLLIEGNVGSVIPRPFLVIVIFWLVVLFMSFGLFAPRNAIAIVALLVCAISVATSLFLVMELSQPFGGIIQLPSAAARNALANLGK
jgi:hypothetical protein